MPKWDDPTLKRFTAVDHQEPVVGLFSYVSRHRFATLRCIDATVIPLSAASAARGGAGRYRSHGLVPTTQRGDVETTNGAYAEAYLGVDAPLAADALTVHPYLGLDAMGTSSLAPQRQEVAFW